MTRQVLLLLALAVTLAGCGTSMAASRHGSSGTAATVDGYGLSIALPDHWNGRIYRRSPSDAITLEAANAALPAEGEVMTGERLGIGNTYIVVDDIGQEPRYLGREGSWQRDPALPLMMRRSDVAGPYEQGFPAGAAISVVIHERPLMIRVRFGSQPSSADLDAVNDVLASMSVTAP